MHLHLFCKLFLSCDKRNAGRDVLAFTLDLQSRGPVVVEREPVAVIAVATRLVDAAHGSPRPDAVQDQQEFECAFVFATEFEREVINARRHPG